MELVLACHRQQDIQHLFQEYTAVISRQDAEVGACLVAQHYEEELSCLEKKYGEPYGRLYLALDHGLPVGCGGLARNDAQFCEMTRLYVKPEYRGQHIGRCLAQRLIADARQIGYLHIRLDTFPFMRSAIRLYESLGFRYIDRYNDNPASTAVFMQLDLSPAVPSP